MSEADSGVREMARVTRPGGVVAACFWDYQRMPVLHTFWAAAAAVDPSRTGEVKRLGGGEGDIAALLTHAGLSDVVETTITARADYDGFDDWWRPFSLGVGPAGAYCQSLPDHREALRRACHELLGRPTGPFALDACAWCARGTV